jgi:S-adenosylmethionine uptake transporter
MTTNFQDIFCLVTAVALLTISDSIVKLLSPKYALREIMLFRVLFAMVFVIAIVQLECVFVIFKIQRPVLHFIRGLMLLKISLY